MSRGATRSVQHDSSNGSSSSSSSSFTPKPVAIKDLTAVAVEMLPTASAKSLSALVPPSRELTTTTSAIDSKATALTTTSDSKSPPATTSRSKITLFRGLLLLAMIALVGFATIFLDLDYSNIYAYLGAIMSAAAFFMRFVISAGIKAKQALAGFEAYGAEELAGETILISSITGEDAPRSLLSKWLFGGWGSARVVIIAGEAGLEAYNIMVGVNPRCLWRKCKFERGRRPPLQENMLEQTAAGPIAIRCYYIAYANRPRFFTQNNGYRTALYALVGFISFLLGQHGLDVFGSLGNSVPTVLLYALGAGLWGYRLGQLIETYLFPNNPAFKRLFQLLAYSSVLLEPSRWQTALAPFAGFFFGYSSSAVHRSMEVAKYKIRNQKQLIQKVETQEGRDLFNQFDQHARDIKQTCWTPRRSRIFKGCIATIPPGVALLYALVTEPTKAESYLPFFRYTGFWTLLASDRACKRWRISLIDEAVNPDADYSPARQWFNDLVLRNPQASMLTYYCFVEGVHLTNRTQDTLANHILDVFCWHLFPGLVLAPWHNVREGIRTEGAIYLSHDTAKSLSAVVDEAAAKTVSSPTSDLKQPMEQSPSAAALLQLAANKDSAVNVELAVMESKSGGAPEVALPVQGSSPVQKTSSESSQDSVPKRKVSAVAEECVFVSALRKAGMDAKTSPAVAAMVATNGSELFLEIVDPKVVRFVDERLQPLRYGLGSTTFFRDLKEVFLSQEGPARAVLRFGLSSP